jgi:hypothetical protein
MPDRRSVSALRLETTHCCLELLRHRDSGGRQCRPGRPGRRPWLGHRSGSTGPCRTHVCGPGPTSPQAREPIDPAAERLLEYGIRFVVNVLG